MIVDAKLKANFEMEAEKMQKSQRHLEICRELNEIYRKKNNDYGDAFTSLRRELPNAILVRIFDKYSRLKTLLNGENPQVKSETIDDTLKDLANYCIMELVERQEASDVQAKISQYKDTD